MKFITMMSLVLAAGVAFGSSCSPEPVKDTAWVYKWQFKGKTTTGKKAKATVSGSACNPGNPATCAIRVPASLKIQGYTWACSPEPCADSNLAFETAFVEALEVFWQSKPYKAAFYGGVTTEFAHLIGKKKKQVEVLGVANLTDDEEGATYVLTYAGFGKVSGKRVKKVSGNFAGYLTQPWNVKKGKVSKNSCGPTASSCIQAGYWDCASLTLVCEAPSIAYGKWYAKYQKSASSKYLKNGTGIKTPGWVQFHNAE